MKHIIAAFLFVAISAGAFAQSTERFPYHTLSKDVQKVQFRGAVYAPATVTTGNVEAVASKGIAKLNSRDTKVTRTKITTPGIPSSVISKGVARMQYERNNR